MVKGSHLLGEGVVDNGAILPAGPENNERLLKLKGDVSQIPHLRNKMSLCKRLKQFQMLTLLTANSRMLAN